MNKQNRSKYPLFLKGSALIIFIIYAYIIYFFFVSELPEHVQASNKLKKMNELFIGKKYLTAFISYKTFLLKYPKCEIALIRTIQSLMAISKDDATAYNLGKSILSKYSISNKNYIKIEKFVPNLYKEDFKKNFMDN